METIKVMRMFYFAFQSDRFLAITNRDNYLKSTLCSILFLEKLRYVLKRRIINETE